MLLERTRCPEAIIAARCADEHTDAQHATERLRDDDVLSNTLSSTLAQEPNVSDSTLRQVWAQRRKSVHEARVRAFSTLAAPILRGTISLVEHEGARVFVRSGDPSPCRPIPLDKFN